MTAHHLATERAPALPEKWARSGPADFTSLSGRLSPNPAPNLDGVLGAAMSNPPVTITETAPDPKPRDVELFDARVHLKVATSQYAMHLSSDERARLFAEVDYLLETEAWDEENALPRQQSFLGFLRWTILSKNSSWTSLGLDGDGSILLAWKKGQNVLTANFVDANEAKWAAQLTIGSNKEVSVGQGPLKSFAEHAVFHLKRF